MKRLDSFMLTVKTGARGRQSFPHIRINNTSYELENIEGDVESGHTLSGSFNPHQDVQQFMLEGPEDGVWDIEELEITYSVREREPYTLKLGAVTLDPWRDLNLAYESPEDSFEV